MIFFMFISVVLYAVFFLMFLFSASCLIIISFICFPLFFKADKFFCRLILMSLGAFPKIIGSFPREGTFIVMMNHSSFLDVFLFPLIPRGAYSGLTAVENFRFPVFSFLLRRLKAIPIDRHNTAQAIHSIRQAEKNIHNGVHIGILPEGSRTVTGKIQPFKKGGFHMAINTKSSIVPVGISGAFVFKPKNRWWLRPSRITINIGKPISYAEYKYLGVDGLKDCVESKIKYLSGEHHENR